MVRRARCIRCLAPLITLALLFCTAAPARAQLTGLSGRSSSVVITDVRAGFGDANAGTLDTWTPVRVTIDSAGQPFSGLLDIEYTQDGSQRARLRVNVSITPGSPGVVRFLLPIFSSESDLSISLYGQAPRPLDQVQFGPTGLALNFAPIQGGKLVASLLDDQGQGPSLDAKFTTWAADLVRSTAPAPPTGNGTFTPTITSPTALWSGVTVTAITPAELDPSWAAYDGLAALVLRADVLSDVDPRALEGLHRWVQRGGLLILLASPAGSDWTAWLPEGPARDALTIDDAARAPMPRSIATLLEAPSTTTGGPQPPPPQLPVGPWPMSATVEAQAAQWGQSVEETQPTSEISQWTAAEDYRKRLAQHLNPPPPPSTSKAAVHAAQEIVSRPIRITPAGRDSGWTTLLPLDERRAAAVQGPVGLGTVVVLGFDPRSVSGVVDLAATHTVWAGLLEPLLRDRIKSGPDRFYGRSSGRDRAEQLAIQTALDRCATTPPIGDGAFYLIAASLLGMAILIGPIDAYILRRLRARHRSWITASAWITLAAAVAYLVPEMMRFGQSAARRISVIDVLQSGSGPSPAWQTSLTGIFSGGPLRCALEDASPKDDSFALPAGPAGATWWRGASSVMVWESQTASRLGGLFSTFQAEPPGMNAAARSALLAPMTMGQWTFRTLLDEGPTTATFRAGVRLVGDEWELTLEGLPESATIQAVSLLLPDGFRDVDLSGLVERPRLGARLWRIPLTREPGNSPFTQRSYDHWSAASGTPITPAPMDSPGRLLDLPGAVQRPHAINALINARTHAGVFVALGNMTPDIRIRELPRTRAEAAAQTPQSSQTSAQDDDPFIALSRDVVARIIVPLGELESRQASKLSTRQSPAGATP